MGSERAERLRVGSKHGDVPGVVKSAGGMAATRLVSGIGGLARVIYLGETKALCSVKKLQAEGRPAWLPWNYPQHSKNPAALDHDSPDLPA